MAYVKRGNVEFTYKIDAINIKYNYKVVRVHINFINWKKNTRIQVWVLKWRRRIRRRGWREITFDESKRTKRRWWECWSKAQVVMMQRHEESFSDGNLRVCLCFQGRWSKAWPWNEEMKGTYVFVYAFECCLVLNLYFIYLFYNYYIIINNVIIKIERESQKRSGRIGGL